MVYATVTVTGKILRDGVPAVGRAILVPSVNTISDLDGNVVLYGPLTDYLDNTGSFSIEAPATDDPNLDPSFGYSLWFELDKGAVPPVNNFGLPTALVTIDLTDLYAAQGYYSSGAYTPVLIGDTGPIGPEGPTGPVGPANTLTPGTVDTVPYGTGASVNIYGAAPNQTIDFVFEAGPTGPQGIQGPKGDPGMGSVSTVNGDAGPDVVITLAGLGGETPAGAQAKANTAETNANAYTDAQIATIPPPSNPLGTVDTDIAEQRGLIQETHTRSTTNTYTAGKLTQVVEKAGATTVKTTTLTYTGDNLTQVQEVANGKTITTTLTYTGSDLTSTSRTVV